MWASNQCGRSVTKESIQKISNSTCGPYTNVAGLQPTSPYKNLRLETVYVGLWLKWQVCDQRVHTKELHLVTVYVGLTLMWQTCDQAVLTKDLHLVTVHVGLILIWKACSQQVLTKGLQLEPVYMGLKLMWQVRSVTKGS